MNTDLFPAPQDIKPFVLHEQPEELAHVCAIRAYGEWLQVTHITHGYIFRRIASGDRISQNNQHHGEQAVFGLLLVGY